MVNDFFPGSLALTPLTARMSTGNATAAFGGRFVKAKGRYAQ
jgi:hypothetical protein